MATYTLDISPDNKRIWVQSPYDPTGHRQASLKELGCSWAKSVKRWTAPLSMDKAREFRRAFGDDLEILPGLWAWASDQLEREGALGSISAMDPTQPQELENVRNLAPTMWKAMQERGYQTVAARFGARAGSHWNADDQGLGKTLEIMAALIEHGTFGTWGIACPASAVMGTWEPEVLRWLEDFDGSVLVSTPGIVETERGTIRVANADERLAAIEDFWSQADEHDIAVIIVNAEMLRSKRIRICPSELCDEVPDAYWHCPKGGVKHKSVVVYDNPALFSHPYDAQVADETHRILLRAGGKRPSQTALGLCEWPLKEGGVRIAASGTPMKGQPQNLWGGFHWLYPTEYPSRWNWAKSRLASTPNKYATSGVTFLPRVREDAQEEFERELGRIMIRRTKEELFKVNPAWSPPPKDRHQVLLPMTPHQRAAYRQLADQHETEVRGGTLSPNGHLAMGTRLKQLASCYGKVSHDERGDVQFTSQLPSNKLDWLVDFLARKGILKVDKDHPAEGDAKVVVSSQYTSMIHLYAGALRKMGINCYEFTGQTSIGERRRIQREWQSDDLTTRVLLLNTAAGGVSLTLDRADDLVVMDETWVPDDQKQVEDRIHRTSRTDHFVNIWILRSMGTIEEDAALLVQKDERNVEYLDGRKWLAAIKRNERSK